MCNITGMGRCTLVNEYISSSEPYKILNNVLLSYPASHEQHTLWHCLLYDCEIVHTNWEIIAQACKTVKICP